MKKSSAILISILTALMISACSTTPKTDSSDKSMSSNTATPATATAKSVVAPVVVPAHLDPNSSLSKNRSVYLDFDKFQVKDEYKSVVESHGKYVGSQADEHSSASTCVITYSNDVRDACAKVFSKAGFKTSVIDESHNLSSKSEIVYFSTMHRAKGLEFDQVIVVSPSEYLGAPLETDSKRKLVYVALTRAKKDAALLLI